MFYVTIQFNLTNGTNVSFSGNGAVGEIGTIDYFKGDAKICVSPRELGICKSVDELITCLTNGVIDECDWEDEPNVKIFAKSRITEGEDGEEYDAYDFVEQIKQNIKSMDDIKSITILGEIQDCGETYCCTYTYDLKTKSYTGEEEGEEFESDNSIGGYLEISDLYLCDIEYTPFYKNWDLCDTELCEELDCEIDDDNDDAEEESLNCDECGLVIENGKITKYKGTDSVVIIPDGIVEIDKYAFSGCVTVSKVIIPNSVTSINCGAFSRCSNLKDVIIPDSVKKIDAYAFSDCSNLASIIIPDSVAEMGFRAFEGCSNLNSVILGTGVSVLHEGVFGYCNRLKQVTMMTDQIISMACDSLRASKVKEITARNSEGVIIPPKYADENYMNNMNLLFKLRTGDFTAKKLLEKSASECLNARMPKFDYYPFGEAGICPIESIFDIGYKNPIIEEILNEYCYEFDGEDCFAIYIETILDGMDELGWGEMKVEPFPYYGVNNINDFTKTLLSFLLYNGTAEEGLKQALIDKFDEIVKNFKSLEGSAFSCTDVLTDSHEGYDFEIKRGKYICKFRECEGGW